MAHRLARYIYAMVTNGANYIAKTMEDLDQRRKDHQKALLLRLAAELNYTLTPP